MSGYKALEIVQYGKETVNGTAVAADTRLVCALTLPESDRELIVPSAGTGKRVGDIVDNAYYRRQAAEGLQLSTPGGAYFQLLPLIFSCCVDGNITPVEQTGSQNDMLWTFTESLTGAEDLDTFTVEVGDQFTGVSAFEVAYCLIPKITLTGNAETGETNIEATIDGDKITPTTLTSVATLPTFEPMHGKKMRLFIDDLWATAIGGSPTEITETLLDYTLEIDGGAHHKRRGGSTLIAGSHGQGAVSMVLTIGVEHNATAVAEAAKFFADTTTPRYIGLQVEGAQIGTGDNHTFKVVMAGVWESWSVPTNREQDGNTIAVGKLRVGLDTTGARAFDVQVTTNVAAI